jgi:hypothetical protein
VFNGDPIRYRGVSRSLAFGHNHGVLIDLDEVRYSLVLLILASST